MDFKTDQTQYLNDSVKLLSRQNHALKARLDQLGLPINPATDPDTPKTHLKVFAETFTGHGLSNLYFASSRLERFFWILFILTSVLFCSYYIFNSFTDFFAFDVISNIRVQYELNLVFPSFIICAWGSKFPIDTAIFECKFNGKTCLLNEMFARVNVVGKGTTSVRYCIRFNGRVNATSQLLSINKIGYDYGLSVSFLVPDEVRFSFLPIYESQSCK